MLPLRRPRDVTRYLSRPVSSAPPMLPGKRVQGGSGGMGPPRSGGSGPSPGLAQLARAAQAALGQIVLTSGGHRDETVLGPDGGQHCQVALDLAPDPAERNAEHALATLEQIHYLVGGRALVHADPVAHQRLDTASE